MEPEDIGKLIESERVKQKLSKVKLSQLSGVSRQEIAALEKGIRGIKTSTDVLVKIFNALNIPIDSFADVIGYNYEAKNLPDKNRVSVSMVPVYTDFPFHAGSDAHPISYEYSHYAQVKPSSKNIEGYIVHGNCLEPTVQDNDIIIVDRDGQIDNGDIVACLLDDELHIARLRKVADELWLENKYGKYKYQECQVIAPIIKIIRNIKNNF